MKQKEVCSVMNIVVVSISFVPHVRIMTGIYREDRRNFRD